MKYINTNIILSTTAATHLLGGLAERYRNLDKYDDVQRPIKIELENAIGNVLDALGKAGMDVMKPRSPFNTYVKLINYQSVPF